MLHLLRLIFVLLIPSMALPAMPEVPPPLPQATEYPLLNFDEVLDWIHAIEEADLENWTPEQIEKSARFLALLAESGTAQSDPIALATLNEDIGTLLCDARGLDYWAVEPAVWNGKIDALLCKGWFHKQSHNLKKFVKKHKTAIIIGAAVIVAATIAIIAVAALSSTAAVSSAAAAAGAAIAGDEGPYQPHPIEPNPNMIQVVEQIGPILDSPALAKILEENTAPLTETLTQAALFEPPILADAPKSSSLVKIARDLGACAAHEILDGVSILIADLPEALDQIGDVGAKFLPESYRLDDNPVNFSENFQETVLALHEKIDQVFSTDQTGKYTPEGKADQNKFTMGILPPPVALGKGAGRVLSIEEFSKAKEFLKPYAGEFISEAQAKELIESTGLSTFPKPHGIPDNWKVRIADKGTGIIYQHPTNTHTSVRVMPGNPNSPLPHQQNPYIVYKIEGTTFDKFGNPVFSKSAEAHIPLDEFVYRD